MNYNTPRVVTIKKIINGGYGLAQLPTGKAVLVRYALPGETVSISLVRQQKRFDYTAVAEVVEPSPDRIAAPCPYYHRCGGCDLQHASYTAQCRLKDEIIRDLLSGGESKTLRQSVSLLRPIIGSADYFGYRQRIRMKIDERGNPGFSHFRSHKIVSIKNCLLAAEPINTCLSELRTHAEFKHLGSISEELELSLNHLSGKVSLHLFLGRPPRPADRRRAQTLAADIDILDRLFFSGQNFAQEGPFGDGEERQDNLLGFEFEDEQPLTLRWEVGGFSQVNLPQNVKMIQLVHQFVRPEPTDRILDLYCGMGNFSVALARQAGAVLGIEGQGSAIRSAKSNAERNHLTNCTFIKSDVASACRDLAARGETFATVVCDPPRRGLSGLAGLAGSLARKRIVYISCDPATLCRDLQELVGQEFCIREIQPLDMFPQTHHLETVVLLEKKSSE